MKIEIDRSWHKKIAERCKDLKIDFLDSPCNPEAIELAKSVKMPIMKVASFEMVDTRLIDLLSKTGKAIMFSTGMANMAENENAINVCRDNQDDDIIILQCTSIYPAPSYLSNLEAMKTIKQAFNVIVGYSDHTLGDHIPIAAVTMGTKVIEKHYTLDRKMDGPDHAFAIQPTELKEMVNKIRDVEAGKGDGIKNGTRKEEEEFYKNDRRSLIANRNIEVGEVIRNEGVVIKRPNYGIHPYMIEIVIVRVARKRIEIDEPITWEAI